MKKIVILGLCLLLAVGLSATAFAAGAGFSMTASSKTLYRGQTVTLTASVSADEVGTSYGLMLSYDTSVFELVSGTTSVPGALVNSFNSGFAFMFQTPTAYTGTVGTVTLRVKDTAAFGSYAIKGSASVKNGTQSVSASGCSVTLTVACNHSYGDWAKIDETNHGRTCSVCQDAQQDTHAWDAGRVIKPATCKESGEKTYSCAQCGAAKTEVIEKTDDHIFGNLTAINGDQHKDTCSVCQKEITQAHQWNAGTVVKPATCKEEGQKVYTCTGCGYARNEEIPVLQTHTWGKWEKVDAQTHKRICSVCDREETGAHDYKTSWSKDSSQHWHECSACRDQKDAQAHIPGPEPTEEKAQTCTVCSYVIKPALGHTHNFSDSWVTDDTGHWYSCSGCEEKGSYADHVFDNACDPDCGVCEYIRQSSHNYQWECDEAKHWQSCTGCGDKTEQTPHTPGPEATETTAQSCSICNYELAPALGGGQTDPTEITEPGDVMFAQDAKDGFPWWILIVAALLVGGGVVLFVLKKKK